jgi:hypothetical protein
MVALQHDDPDTAAAGSEEPTIRRSIGANHLSRRLLDMESSPSQIVYTLVLSISQRPE